MPGRAALLLALLCLACRCGPAGGSDADPSNATSDSAALANVTSSGGNASNASASAVSTAAPTTTTTTTTTGTTTTTTTTTTTVDPVLLGLSERLQRTLSDTGAMEATLVNLRTKLAGTQQVFSGAMRTLMEEQPRLWQLSQSASMTGRKTVMLSRVAAGLSTNAKTIASKLNATQTQMADVVAGASAAAKTAKQLNSMGEFRARFGGCLDAKDPIRDGAEVQVFTCLKGQKSQQWSVNPQLNFVRLLKGPCLAAPKPSEEGSSVMLWSCNTNLPSQKWVYDESTGLLKSSGGLCLAAADPAAKGSSVTLRPCDTVSRGQLWDVVVGNAGLRMRMDALNDEPRAVGTPIAV